MTSSRITIRKSTNDDVEEIAELMCQLGYPTTGDEMYERFQNINNHPAYQLWLAEYDGAIAGLCGASCQYYFEKNGLYIRIAALITKEAFRKKGIAGALLSTVEKWANEMGVNDLHLNCGNREERTAAHKFYLENGFTAKSTGYFKTIASD